MVAMRLVYEDGTTASAEPIGVAFTVCGHTILTMAIDDFVMWWTHHFGEKK